MNIPLVRAQRAISTEPRPQPAVAAIIDTLEAYRLVAIGEAHRSQQLHDFIVTLLQDPRFLPGGGDVVVEFGNAPYQGVIDRYTSGEPVIVHPGATLFVVADWMTAELDTRLGEWRRPPVVRLKGTWLGHTHLGPPSGTPRFEDIADAFLYLRPTVSLTTSVPSSEIYRDTAYLRELGRRDGLQGGANSSELRRLSTKYLRGKT